MESTGMTYRELYETPWEIVVARSKLREVLNKNREWYNSTKR